MNNLILLIFENGLRIAIPKKQLKEIKETNDKKVCIVNGHRVRGGFEELLLTINPIFCSKESKKDK